MTNNEKAMRDAFEKWAREVNPVGLDQAVRRKPDSDDYFWSGTNFAWQVWQASAANSEQQIKELVGDLERARIMATEAYLE